jgi:hypothetical protein
MPTKPTPGADVDTWGAELNEFLDVAHNADGTLKDNVAGRLSLLEANGGPAKLDVANTFTEPVTITRTGSNLLLRPDAAEGRMQIQWHDLTAHGGRTGPKDVVSMDVHGSSHWHWELYTYAVSPQTLVKRIAVDYDVDNPFVTMHGAGLFLEGQSTAENAAGDDPILRFGGTKALSREMELWAFENELRFRDREGGDVVRLTVNMETGVVRLDTGPLKLGTGVSTGVFIEAFEQTADPAAPAANGVRLFAKDNGAGKTQLVARFNTGATQVVATQP